MNSALADGSRMLLGDALTLMVSLWQAAALRSPTTLGHSVAGPVEGRSEDDDEEDIDSDCFGLPGSSDDDDAADFEYISWCRARYLPEDIGLLRRRFARCRNAGAMHQRLEGGWLHEAVLCETALQEAHVAASSSSAPGAGPACSVDVVPDLGLIQLAADLRHGFCNIHPAIAAQLGLELDVPLITAIVLSDSALATAARTEAAQGSFVPAMSAGDFAALRFSQGVGSFTAGRGRYVLDDVLPRVFEQVCAGHHGGVEADWLKDAKTQLKPGNNLFQYFFMAAGHLLGHSAAFCPVCLDRHLLSRATTKLFPCSKQLCRFRFAEHFISVDAELLRDIAAVELHLAIAGAAVDGQPSAFEPFPPNFHSRQGAAEPRGGYNTGGVCKEDLRTAAVSSGYYGGASSNAATQEKDMRALREAIKSLPVASELCSKASDGDAQELVRFLLGSCSSFLMRVDGLPEHRLMGVARR